MLREPLVANTSVRVLINKLEGFITTCLKSSDEDVIVGLPDTQREILTYVTKVTGVKFDTWKLLSEACKQGTPQQIGLISTNVLAPTRPTMTRDQTVSKLESYREQYEDGEKMTLNAAPNCVQVCMALGVSHETANFNPTNERQRS